MFAASAAHVAPQGRINRCRGHQPAHESGLHAGAHHILSGKQQAGYRRAQVQRRARLAATNTSGVGDPLFRAIDADDFRRNGSSARDFTNLTQNGLVRVTMALPPNVRLLDCGATVPCPASAQPTAETEADVWRSVPSILDVSITGPDGQAMAAGAAPLPDPDPVLNATEQLGKQVFNRACVQCHGNQGRHPSGSVPLLQGVPGTPTALLRYHDILTACPRPVDTVTPPRFVFAACSPSQMRNVRTYQITNNGTPPSGTACGGPAPQPPCVTRLTTSDPGRLLLTGFPQPGGPGDIQHLDIPSLRGISLTAPYFSNNTAATLEDMLEHYQQFFKRVQAQNPAAPLLTTQPGVTPPVIDRPFTDAQTSALLAYLRKL